MGASLHGNLQAFFDARRSAHQCWPREQLAPVPSPALLEPLRGMPQGGAVRCRGRRSAHARAC
eukprot:6319936-Pyramimonas_sp.AAC.1